jgi:outer membrane protein OmpA-like peptidoglycan-associated protein
MKKHWVGLACLILFAVQMAAQDVPKAEVYGGYTYLRFNASAPTNAFSANGGQGSFQYNFKKWIGFVAELGGVHNGSLTIGTSPTLHPDQTAFTYLFGPRVSINKGGVVSPFFEVFGGGFHNSRSFNLPTSLFPSGPPSIPGVTVTPNGTLTKFASTQNAAALAVGGGIDIRLSHHIAIRPIELDYVPTNFSPFNVAGLGSRNNATWQQNLRYSAGVDFRFGGAPPIPPKATCAATPAEVLPWEGPVNASVQTADFNPKHSLNYNWTSTSGAVAGQGTAATVDTTNVTPGSYTLTANVTDPKVKHPPFNAATCTASFTVKQPQPPSLACSASPSSVDPGQPVTITVQGSSPDGSRIEKRNFSASSGALKEGDTTVGSQPGQFTTVATLDTSNAPPGALTVNVGVTDVHGFSGSCTASASINAPPPPPVQVASESLISDCDFTNAKKMARVDNQCKATLDEVAMRLQQEPNGRLVIVGYAEENEDALVNNVEGLRAVNAKSYLTGGEAKQQIDPARIEARESSDRGNGSKTRFYFVPEGGNFTVQNTTVVDESSLPADRTGAPKKQKAHSGTAAAPPGQ